MKEQDTDRDAAATLYRHARREARVVAIVWGLALLWTVGYCYTRGYEHSPTCILVKIGVAVPRSGEAIQTYFGIPDWVMFGIVAPWVACTLFALVFSLFWMKDDDLGTDVEEGTGHGA